ncbi:MAG: Bor/Iss family lipoprotein [Myxococcales bacterium]
MRRKGIVLACLLGTAGCYKATFLRDTNAIRGVERDKWADFFLFGLVGEVTIDVAEFCPRGRVAEVQTGGNLGTGVIYALTLGIYTPRKVYVTCAADQAGQARSVSEVRP